jgi:hypothetical protein
VAFVVRQIMPHGSQVTKWAAMRVLVISMGCSIVIACLPTEWAMAFLGGGWRFNFFWGRPHTPPQEAIKNRGLPLFLFFSIVFY